MPKLALVIAITFALLSPAQQEGRLSVAGAPTFVSPEGRFSIALPDRTGFSALSIPTPVGLARGDMYEWRTKEATFGVGYADAPQTLSDPEIIKQVLDAGAASFKTLASPNSGNVGDMKRITLDKYQGVEQRADLFTGSIVQRTYIVDKRIYQIVVAINNGQRAYESLALKVLDSFKILGESEAAARTAEEAAKAEPSPLPQTPVTTRAGTDASDEGLHGPVKTVLTESQELSGPSSVQTRKRELFETYNEEGNTLKLKSYDEEGKLSQITVYGYIDGSRVSASKFIEYEYIPPVRRGIIVATPGTPVKKPDSRYSLRFEFKYDDKKRLVEETSFYNNGDLQFREVYKYKGNQREELDYVADGALTERHLQVLDDKGNAVEETVFDTQDDSVHLRQAYSYEFDSKGNWIKRTTFKIVTKAGRERRQPQSVHFRTITYY